MDSVLEIKSRLSIDQLVGRYIQLQKKGRNFVGLCPFHQDSHPSFLVSPDKGICYCFPCQKGGDIFSFYQQIEGVDFKQALKDLADMAGVTLPDVPVDVIKKDEKERARDCLSAAESFFAKTLQASDKTKQYLADRGVSNEESVEFGLGVAPDSFTATYEYLLKAGFSRKEIQNAGLGVQKDLNEEKIYDRFRNRLMFPIHDGQGRIIGFGGRTLGDDDAKYVNNSDSPLYHKSSVLYGLHRAMKSMREKNRVVLVEGYFDVLACHRVGITEAVAACGTALTEEHVKLLKRYVERVVLCLDQDRAGRDAAERAFKICSKEGLQVEGVILNQKDPADVAVSHPDTLRIMLTEHVRPYLDLVFAEVRSSNLSIPSVRHEALDRILGLLESLSSSTERAHIVRQAASALGITETTLIDDLQKFEKQQPTIIAKTAPAHLKSTVTAYSSAELTLGLFLLYPRNSSLLQEMIPPEEVFPRAIYDALKKAGDSTTYTLDTLELSDEDRKKAGILMLYCEDSKFSEWNDAVATLEIRRNCRNANREMLHRKQKDVTQKLLEAQKMGRKEEITELTSAYQELLQLSKHAQ